MKILKVIKLTKKFGGVIANDNISLNLEKGTILGLIGPNGAGKTTFFNCISGFSKIDSGKIFLEDQEITGLPADRICKLGMTRTFQVVKSAENMKIIDYVMSGAFCRTWSSIKAKETALYVLSFIGFGLYEQRTHLVKELTLSQRKALQIASVFATKPKIILLDEAMSGLTEKEQQDAINLIMKIKGNGISLIVVEHVMNIIMSISDKIVVLNGGKKIADDIPMKVANKIEVTKAYLGG